MPARTRRRRRRTAAVLATATAGAIAVGPVPAAEAAQPAQFHRGAERTVSVRYFTGEQLTCTIVTGLDRWLDPGPEAHALLSVYGDDGCQDDLELQASVQYRTPGGEVLWSRAYSGRGPGVIASAEPVDSVIKGHYHVGFGRCDENTTCSFQYELAAPK